VIARFLTVRHISSNHSTDSEPKIGTTVVLFTGNAENPLFQTNFCLDSTGSVHTEMLEETATEFFGGGVGGEDGCLLVEGGTTVVGH
jgi:hypothetical protein